MWSRRLNKRKGDVFLSTAIKQLPKVLSTLTRKCTTAISIKQV